MTTDALVATSPDEQEAIVVMTKCRRCGMEKVADARDKHLCVDCAKAEQNRASYLRRHQGDWMAAANDAGIDVWLQQPGETNWEYTIWCAYRDSYPGKLKSHAQVAEEVGTTRNFVAACSSRWTFAARMQMWKAECDRITMEQRRSQILEMNSDHISMAKKLRDKMSLAIDAIDPLALKPTELTSLMKLATDLERKAQIDQQAQEEMRANLSVVATENPDIKKSPTKQDDLGEVIKILLSTGALGSITQIGVRETTTREVVAKSSDGDEVMHIEED